MRDEPAIFKDVLFLGDSGRRSKIRGSTELAEIRGRTQDARLIRRTRRVSRDPPRDPVGRVSDFV